MLVLQTWNKVPQRCAQLETQQSRESQLEAWGLLVPLGEGTVAWSLGHWQDF